MITKAKRFLARHGIGNPLNQLMYDADELSPTQKISVEPIKLKRGRKKGWKKYTLESHPFGIKAGAIMTRLRFATESEAQEFGEKNYRGQTNWKVINLQTKPNRITKEQKKIGTMEVVIKDLKNIMFWAKFGLQKARGGSAMEDTVNAIESYSEYLGYSETKKVEPGKFTRE
jgi:hypothetical protein